jgi:signal transduction histidine kinase/Tfp pilus assembly protein PilF
MMRCNSYRKLFLAGACWLALHGFFCSLSFAQDREKFLLDSLEKSLAGTPDSTRMKRMYQFAKDNLNVYPRLSYRVAEDASKLAIRAGDKRREAMNYSLLGVVEKNNGEYEKALDWQLKSLKLNEEINDKKSLAISHNDLGVLYKVMKDYPTALVHYQQSLELCREIGMQNGIAFTLSNIGTIYDQMGENDKALDYYHQSLAKAREINNEGAMVNALSNIGEMLAKTGKTQEALTYFLDAIKIDRKNDDKYGMILSSVNLGNTYKDLGNYSEAKKYLEDAVQIAKENDAAPMLANCYSSLSGLYERTGDYRNALKYHQLYTSINDSILNTERTKQLAEMQTKYETTKKEEEISRLSQESKITALQLEQSELRSGQRRNLVIVLSVLVLFVIVISVLLVNRNRLKSKEKLSAELLMQEQLRNKAIIITQENERKRIAEELHDGIGQMMSAVKLNVAALESNLREKNEQYQSTIDLIDESCKELRTISHNMMPGILIKAGLVPAVKELVSKINTSGTINISVEADDARVRLGETIEVNFFRIIQELITNIIKYANASEAQVTISMENDLFTIMIEDNGNGFDKEVLKTSAGNGWNNILSRLQLLNGKIEIDSQPGKGTVVFIEAPLKNFQ